MDHSLREHNTLAKDLNMAPAPTFKWLTNISNSRPDTLFRTPQVASLSHALTQIHTANNKINNL